LKPTRTNRSKSKASQGTVQIAVWKESPEVVRAQDVFTNYSQDMFYDFAKPLRLLDSPGWSAAIRIESKGDDGFFVFSSNDRLDSSL